MSPCEFASDSLISQSKPLDSHADMTRRMFAIEQDGLKLKENNDDEVSTSSSILYNCTAVQNISYCFTSIPWAAAKKEGNQLYLSIMFSISGGFWIAFLHNHQRETCV